MTHSSTLDLTRPVPSAANPSPPPADFRIAPLQAALGAEVRGLDATCPVPASQVLSLKQALLNLHVLVIKNQQLEDDAFARLASYFGRVFDPPANVPVLGYVSGALRHARWNQDAKEY